MKRAGQGAVAGGTIRIEIDPFSLRLIQIDAVPPVEPIVAGIPYEIVPGPDAGHFGINLLGTPGQHAEVSFLGFGDCAVRTLAGRPVPTGATPWRVVFPGSPSAGPSFVRLADPQDDASAAADGARLAELAKLTIDDDALEIRELVRSKREPSRLPEIEACRAYMWDKVVAAEGTFRNAFDGDPATRWSDGFPRRSPFTGSPTNFLGETPAPRRVLSAVNVPAEDAPGREYAIAVTAGPAKFDPVDGVYVVALVDGRPVVPLRRASSYPYHNFEWNSGAPKLAGMTFRLPIGPAWKSRTVAFRIMMFGDGADGARAELRHVTPKPVFVPLSLRSERAPGFGPVTHLTPSRALCYKPGRRLW